MRLRISETLSNQYDFAISHGREDWDKVATVSSVTWAAEYAKHTSYIPTGLMPPAVRFLSADHRLIVWERPPAYQSLNYSASLQELLNPDLSSAMTFRLPIPWQTYVLYLSPEGRLANVFCFFHPRQRFELNEALYLAPLPNLYSSGRLCQAVYSTLQDNDRTVAGAMHAAYNMIWNSGFNNDTLLAFNHLAQHRIPGNPLSRFHNQPYHVYSKWLTYPLPEVLKWGWPDSGMSLLDFLSNRHYLENLHDYTGTHEMVVNMVFAAQDAEIKN